MNFKSRMHFRHRVLSAGRSARLTFLDTALKEIESGLLAPVEFRDGLRSSWTGVIRSTFVAAMHATKLTTSSIVVSTALWLRWTWWRCRSKSEIFMHWTDWNGLTNATPRATEVYLVTGQWADEIPNHEPDPKLEHFYVLAAMELGDPRVKEWIINNAEKFHALYAKVMNNGRLQPWIAPTILVQYLLWYERDGPKIN
jgi:hypothetical protein